jgi:NADH:ubiquinone oxidoreductase subunit H
MYNTPDLIYSIDSYESRINALMSYIDNIDYPYSTEFSFAFTTKLAACLSFLILIRGGVPRYRYDILTKLCLVNFFGFVLAVFIFTLITFFLF